MPDDSVGVSRAALLEGLAYQGLGDFIRGASGLAGQSADELVLFGADGLG